MANPIVSQPTIQQVPKVIAPILQIGPPDVEIMATVLPDGRADQWLRFTVLISPRLLVSAPPQQKPLELQFSYFKSIFNWPAIRSALKFQVVFDGVATPFAVVPEWETMPAPQNVDPFDANLWATLFPDSLLVRPYQFDQGVAKYTGDKYLIVAPAEKRFFQSVKADLYGKLAVESPDRLPQKGMMLQKLQDMNMVKPDVQMPGKFQKGFENPRLQLNILQDQLFKSQLGSGPLTPGGLPGGPLSGPGGIGGPGLIMPRGVSGTTKRTLPKMSDQQLQSAGMTAKQVDLLKYHAVYDAPTTIKPRPEVPKVDFHQLISSLGDYPELMKRIGLRIDLRVQFDAKIPPRSTMFVKVLAPAPVVPKVPTPRTRYMVTADAFRAATTSPELQDGLLAFGRQTGGVRIYDVVPGDVEGSFKRVANFSELLLNPKNTEELAEEISLPTLRSAGLSVAHNDRDEWLDQLLDRHKAMSATAKSAITFAGEDLIRGYRIDVREVLRPPGGPVTFGPWRSLCFRHGEHRLGANPAPVLIYDDEGWISLGATEGEDPTPKVRVGTIVPQGSLGTPQMAIPQIQPRAVTPAAGISPIASLAMQAALGAIQVAAKPILHIYESLFRWAGWSLCVPRPGKDLNPADNPDYSGHQPIPGIPMQVFFNPVLPGTLPRLRFGKQYQFRARVVDLAGNSLPVTFNPPENPLYVTDVNDGYHDRFEPVSSPILVLTQPTKGPKPAEVPLLPGDFAARMVIRTINLETPQDVAAGPATAVSIRHILPPRVSEELAEQHGVFDAMPPQQAYQIMTDKDLDLSEQWQQDPASPIGKKAVKSELPEFVVLANQSIEVPYLPDPLAAGVSFYKLPGSAAPAFVVQQPFGGAWPRRVGFKIQIEEGNGPPVLQGDVYKIFVPQGEHIRAQASCFFPPGAENLMGLWRWIEERMGQQSDNSPMSILVRQGRHWLLTPPRELNLVHAVQQPLFNPLWASLFNPVQATQEIPIEHIRKAGDTHAYLYGTIAVHRGSTEEFDLEARWSEPVDSGVALTDPPQRVNGQSQAFQVPVIEQAAQRVVARGVDGQEAAPPLDIDLTERGIPTEGPLPQEHSSVTPPAGETGQGTAASGEVQERAVPLAAQISPGAAVLQANPSIVAQPQPQGPPPYDERPFRCATQLPPLPPNLAPHQYRFAGKQKFIDTKYRCVEYVAIGKTRYRDYFLPTRDEEQEVRKNYDQAVAAALAQKTPPPPAPPLPKWTRASQPVKVDILSTAPPAKPEVLYIVPTFRWEATPQGHRRVGGGLRIYLDRPWFSSGDGEQLAVVLFPDANAELSDHVKPYVTQWGLDPLWIQGPALTGLVPQLELNPKLLQNPPTIQPRSVPGEAEEDVTSRAAPQALVGDAAAMKINPALLFHQGVGQGHPTPAHFRNEVAVRYDLGIREVPVPLGGVTTRAAGVMAQVQIAPQLLGFMPMPVTICVFDVKPDVSRQLWYCDIEMDPGTAYFPFVRLALARYQVNSISRMHLSPVVQADFAQLVPDRLVSATPDPKNSNALLVSVTGVQGYAGPSRLTVAEASLEEANPNVPGELGWVPVPNSAVKLSSTSPQQWVGSVTLPPASPKVYRLIVKEYEQFSGKEADIGGQPFDRTASRLVFADVLPLQR